MPLIRNSKEKILKQQSYYCPSVTLENDLNQFDPELEAAWRICNAFSSIN